MPGKEVVDGVHGNRSVEIIFDSSVVGPEVSYDRTTGQCAVSCHDHGGARSRLAWTEKGPLGCGDCHGAPPAGHYAGLCTQCHDEPNATGTELTAQKLHFNGRVDLGDGSGTCGACHGQGDDPGPATGAHLAHRQPRHTTPIACNTCHVVPKDVHDPGHFDGKVLVTFSGHAVDRGATPIWNGTACTTVACHGAGIRTPRVVPAWTDTSGAASACDACHGAPPTQHTPSAACDRSGCHGTEIIRAGSSLAISESGKAFHVDGVINPIPP
jgi:predicted CxxxxCH...CXXCH cytochrome family protein